MSDSLSRIQKQRLRKLKKKVYKINYLNEELEDTIQTISEYSHEFNEAITKWLKSKGADDVLAKMFPQMSEEEILANIDLDEVAESSDSSRKDPWVKEIYRQIASETHADKIAKRDDLSDSEKEEREKLFIKANKALENNDGPALYIMAVEMGLKMSNIPDDILDYFDVSIGRIQEQISLKQNSHAWHWAEADLSGRIRFLENLCKGNDIEFNTNEIVNFLNDYNEQA